MQSFAPFFTPQSWFYCSQSPYPICWPPSFNHSGTQPLATVLILHFALTNFLTYWLCVCVFLKHKSFSRSTSDTLEVKAVVLVVSSGLFGHSENGALAARGVALVLLSGFFGHSENGASSVGTAWYSAVGVSILSKSYYYFTIPCSRARIVLLLCSYKSPGPARNKCAIRKTLKRTKAKK